MAERKTIYLCLAHMSEEGWEQKYVKEAFDTNWVVPMGPNVNAFEEDLRRFVTSNAESAVYGDSRWPEANPASWHLNEAQINTFSFSHIIFCFLFCHTDITDNTDILNVPRKLQKSQKL